MNNTWVIYQHTDDFHDTRRQLGFKLQDKVSISNRFFLDHKLPITYIGSGVVIAKVMPTSMQLPALIIEFPFHPIFVTEPFKKLIIPMQQTEAKITVIKIHPLYVELVERVDAKKRKPKRV